MANKQPHIDYSVGTWITRRQDSKCFIITDIYRMQNKKCVYYHYRVISPADGEDLKCKLRTIKKQYDLTPMAQVLYGNKSKEVDIEKAKQQSDKRIYLAKHGMFYTSPNPNRVPLSVSPTYTGKCPALFKYSLLDGYKNSSN